jgi:hypothetical protein
MDTNRLDRLAEENCKKEILQKVSPDLNFNLIMYCIEKNYPGGDARGWAQDLITISCMRSLGNLRKFKKYMGYTNNELIRFLEHLKNINFYHSYGIFAWVAK